MMRSNRKKLLTWEIIGAVVTIGLSFLFHFLYELSGKNEIVGIFSAVNESVWEHTKILFFPYFITAIIEYFILKPDFKRFFIAKTAGLLAIDLFTICFFYVYSGVLGYNVLAVDIISAVLWIIVAYIISYKMICSRKDYEKYLYTWILIFALLMIAFFLFTVAPPEIALFMDKNTGKYGMQ